jgi:hypothetical protein
MNSASQSSLEEGEPSTMILLDAKTTPELELAYQEALSQGLLLRESAASDVQGRHYFVNSPTMPALAYAVMIYQDWESGECYGDCTCYWSDLGLICPDLGLAYHHYCYQSTTSAGSNSRRGEWVCKCGFPVIITLTHCPFCRQPKPEWNDPQAEAA